MFSENREGRITTHIAFLKAFYVSIWMKNVLLLLDQIIISDPLLVTQLLKMTWCFCKCKMYITS